MVDLFKISNGPWEKLFEGVFQGSHSMSVFSNDKSQLLVMIFDGDAKNVTGAVAELYKVFFAHGEMEAFTESLPRELILLEKHNEKETLKFLLLSSTPTYIEWKEDLVIQEIDRLLKKIETSSQILVEVSKAYDITFEELSKAKSQAKKTFFSMPLLIPVISTNYQETESSGGQQTVAYHDFFIGLTREKNRIVEPITLFSKTLVVNGQKNERNQAVQLLSEAYLLSGSPIVVFDFENRFSGLKQPNSNTQELEKYQVQSEPIGFPIRSFEPFSDLKIDLNYIDPFGFSEAFGFGQSKCVEIIATTLLKSRVVNMKDLILRLKDNKEFSEYEVNRTARILGLLSELYPTLFDGTNPIEEIATKKVKSLGRGALLDLSKLDEKARLVLSHNLLSGLLDYFSKNDKRNGLACVIIIPDIKNSVNEKIGSVLSKEVANILTKFENFELGYVLSSEVELDFPKELVNNYQSEISIVKGNDCAVQVKGRKNYRVLLRPTLSSVNFGQTTPK